MPNTPPDESFLKAITAFSLSKAKDTPIKRNREDYSHGGPYCATCNDDNLIVCAGEWRHFHYIKDRDHPVEIMIYDKKLERYIHE